LLPLVDRDPYNTVNVRNLGSANLALHRYREAASLLTLLEQRNEANAIDLAKLAWCEAELGRTAQARRHLAAAQQRDADNATVQGIASMVARVLDARVLDAAPAE
jgi:predicted Zn-dependent protease